MKDERSTQRLGRLCTPLREPHFDKTKTSSNCSQSPTAEATWGQAWKTPGMHRKADTTGRRTDGTKRLKPSCKDCNAGKPGGMVGTLFQRQNLVPTSPSLIELIMDHLTLNKVCQYGTMQAELAAGCLVGKPPASTIKPHTGTPATQHAIAASTTAHRTRTNAV